MSPIDIGIVGLIFLVVILFSRMPVGFCFTITGILGFGYLVSPEAAFNVLAKDFYTSFSSYSLAVIPLFVFMGQILFQSGIGRDIFTTVNKWLGHYPGGLAMAAIAGCAAFGAICGSANATAATMGTVVIPEMRRYGYRDSLATGVVAAGGGLGILIPPSIVFIIYGSMTEQSIGKLFMAGFLPGILLSLLFMITVYIWVLLKPETAPRRERCSIKERILSLKGIGEVLILFLIVIGGIFFGVFTPNEAAGIGAAGGLIIPLLRRKLKFNDILLTLYFTTKTTCMLLTILAGAFVLGHFLTVTTIPTALSSWVMGLPFPRWGIMGMIILIYFIGGCFVDSLGMIILTVPIFYPVIIALGYDPILFGVIIVLVVGLGGITPPVGILVYIVKGMNPDISLETVFSGATPFVLAILVGVIILIAFPQISLFLPSLMR